MYQKLLISSFLILLVALSSVQVVDRLSSSQLDTAFKRSVTVFAIARGLNGLISVVQGTEVYATPAGVGVNFAIGQIVDPMNDMVERFSWVMLMSSVSLGVQEIVLHLGQTQIVQTLFTLSAFFVIAMLWIPKLWHAQSFNFLFKFFIVFFFLRFAVPMIVLVNEGIYSHLLEPKYQEAKAALEFSSGEIKGIISEVKVAEQSQIKVYKEHEQTLMEKAQSYVNETLDSLDIKKQLENLSERFHRLLENLEEKFDHAIEYILILITIFIVESILLPLFVLWVFLRLFRTFFQSDIATIIEKKTIENA